MRGIFGLAAKLLEFQEGLCSMMLYCWLVKVRMLFELGALLFNDNRMLLHVLTVCLVKKNSLR